MKKTRIVALVIAVVGFAIIAASLAVEPEAKKAEAGKLRHVVLFKFKDDAPADKIKEIEDAFRALPQKIPEIADFEWGTNVSVENRSEGFTHCFLVTFHNAEGRAVYLPHPAHKELGKLLRPYIEQVLVVDFVPKKSEENPMLPGQSRQPATGKTPLDEQTSDSTTKPKIQSDQTKSYWLTASSNTRHNSKCRYYQKTKGRACGPDEGTPCKICGG